MDLNITAGDTCAHLVKKCKQCGGLVKVCEVCGKDYPITKISQMTCSSRCRNWKSKEAKKKRLLLGEIENDLVDDN